MRQGLHPRPGLYICISTTVCQNCGLGSIRNFIGVAFAHGLGGEKEGAWFHTIGAIGAIDAIDFVDHLGDVVRGVLDCVNLEKKRVSRRC